MVYSSTAINLTNYVLFYENPKSAPARNYKEIEADSSDKIR
jgi:hypothetical protein